MQSRSELQERLKQVRCLPSFIRPLGHVTLRPASCARAAVCKRSGPIPSHQLLLQGWLEVSMSKYAMGSTSISQAQYRESPDTCVHVASTSSTGNDDLQLQGGGAAELQQQLRGFGGMVSPHLREAQRHFVAALNAAVACANAQRRLRVQLDRELGERGGVGKAAAPLSDAAPGAAENSALGSRPSEASADTRDAGVAAQGTEGHVENGLDANGVEDGGGPCST